MEPDILWYIPKSVPLVPIHSQIHPIHNVSSYFLRLNIKFSSHLHQFLLSVVIPLASNVPFTQKLPIVKVLTCYDSVQKSTH